MSQLYLSESGRVVPTLCEELTTYRRTRKLLHLPPTEPPTAPPLPAGTPKQQAAALADLTDAAKGDPLPGWLTVYDAVGWAESRLYEGAVDMLDAVRRAGARVLVITAKPQRALSQPLSRRTLM